MKLKPKVNNIKLKLNDKNKNLKSVENKMMVSTL